MFVVLGATGHTGSVVADTLLQNNQSVRVIVRSADKGAPWKAKGAEVAIASYGDVTGLTRALHGAAGVYLLVPPSYEAQPWLAAQERVMDRAVQAVKAAGIAHVVFLSSIGAHIAEGTGPIRAVRYGEQQLKAAVRNLTLLRPPYFIENWAPVLGSAKGQGVLPTFLAPHVKIPMIATRDIGRIGAERLLAGGRGLQIVELAGPEEYSPDNVAEALSHLLGRPIAPQVAPLSAVAPTFKSFGFSDDAAHMFEEMYTGFSNQAIGYEFPGKLVRGSVTLSEALRGMV